ncbi:hypothetical protein SmJEL517_g05172 [Synchytrium microbalum]|uniref:Ras suppressor protein 1 n=1 Tax=Synchytrium microbalum TaxID=1806994 RepID=A0A507C0N2_9FUNG|nr:uncharacterized protein SmJEL517_g05172 [Synchytrium microbalum]TPX31526.1 hypothetical protein SmJEL517_g05172 [Synchytrium microbalum]
MGRGIKQILEEARHESSNMLDLDEQGLKEIPSELWEIQTLGRLNLSHNKITDLPEDIARLSKLELLTIFNNKLDSLPKSISSLPLLKIVTARHLVLRDNKLVSLPKEIGKLKEIRFLLLQGNRLTTLPKELANTPLDSSGAKLRLAGNPLASAIVDVLKRTGVPGLFALMRTEEYEKDVENTIG